MVPTTSVSSEVSSNVVEEHVSNIVNLPDNAALESSQQQQQQQQLPHQHHHHHRTHHAHHGHHSHGHHHPHHAANGHHSHHHANGNAAMVHPMMHPHAHPHHPHHQMVMPPMPHHPNYNYLASQYTSLYVGDLAPDVNEIMLSELFSKVGRSAVASIHVCRDSVTFRSLGYAYVNFFNSIDAERALDTLNYSQIMGRPCRIMWSLRDPTKRKSNVGNIFVKNLDRQVDNAMLFDTFSKFGNILSCKIEYEKGSSKGYGYVHFETQESSDRAIQGVNGTILCGKPITVEQFVSKVERFKEKNEHKLFIKNIDELATTEQLQTELARFGEIESCIIRLDSNGKSKGLGFVEFKSVEDAQRLMDSTDPIQVLSKPITIDRIKNKMERNIEHRQIKQQQQQQQAAPADANANTNGTAASNSAASTNLTLFIHNIDETIDKEVIREEFAKHGSILGIKIVQENGKNRGFGFLSYSTQEEANSAIEKMNGFMLGSKALSVSFSNRKYKKRMQQIQVDPSQPTQSPHMQLLPYYYRNPYHPHHQGQVFHPHQPYYTHAMPPMPPAQLSANHPRYNGSKQLQAQGQQQPVLTMTTPPPYKGARTPLPMKQNAGSPSQPNGSPSSYRKPRTFNPNHHTSNNPRNNRYNKDSSSNASGNDSTPTTPPPENASPQQVASPSNESLTAAAGSPVNITYSLDSLLAMAVIDAKDIVGTDIYNIISSKYPSQAPKIAGMIVNSHEIKELYEMVVSGEIHNKIEQAQSMLNGQHSQQPIVAN